MSEPAAAPLWAGRIADDGWRLMACPRFRPSHRLPSDNGDYLRRDQGRGLTISVPSQRRNRIEGPIPSSDQARIRMERQRMRDTAPELVLRSLLHRMDLRFRVDRQVIPGLRHRADIVFVTAKIAVFVDGCFWHACPEHGTWPKANHEWWRAKLERNVERDRATDGALQQVGWVVIRVWEHDDPEQAALRIMAEVGRRSIQR